MGCKVCGEKLTYHDSGYYCLGCHDRKLRVAKEKQEKKYAWLLDALEELKDSRPSKSDKKHIDELIRTAHQKVIGYW